MEKYFQFFSKIDSPPDFLKNYFDNFIVVYGLIINLNNVISKVYIRDDDKIEYVVKFTDKAIINYDVLDSLNTTVNLYGEKYSVNAIYNEESRSLSLYLS